MKPGRLRRANTIRLRYASQSWQRHLETQQHEPDQFASGKRKIAIGIVMALVLVGLAARLAYWQIGRQHTLTALARNQHLRALVLPSGRGTIFDANGSILAMTVTENVLTIDPAMAQTLDRQAPGTLDDIAHRLSTTLNLDVADVRTQLELPGGYHILTGPEGLHVRLSPDTSALVQYDIDTNLLPGMRLQPEPQRTAPNGSLASQVLGFVQSDTGIGRYGVEQAFDGQLAGKSGMLFTAVDANDNPIFSGNQHELPATSGSDVTLTLDTNIQAMVESRLSDAVASTQADGGTVIVTDPATGAILAMASTHGFDPNDYSAAPLSALENPAVSATYDPGSTMKAITMAAGVDAGVIAPDTTFDDNGAFTVGAQTIYNWDQLAWGAETMTQVLAHSSNVGAAWVAVNRLGASRFDAYRALFGFGAATGVALPGESAGILPPSEPTSALTNLDLAENAFGESIGVTPLQMVMAYGALANGGQLMRPQIVQAVTHDGVTQHFPPVAVRQVISRQTATTITGMLVDSAQHSDAQTWLLPGYRVAAKTGTSTPDPQDATNTFATVLGYAPADHPRFVLLVKLDHPRTTVLGGEAAGPLWRELTRLLLAYDQIPAQEGN